MLGVIPQIVITRIRPAFLALALVTVGPVQAQSDQIDQETLPGLSSVIDELRQGGLVIFFRHARTDASIKSDDGADMTRCETQRNLSLEGRADAKTMGEAIRRLGIPIGTVLTAPSCRTRDTAQLLFGNAITLHDLRFVFYTNASETRYLTQILRHLLATPPTLGNTVLVSHSANLYEATGIFAKPEGAAYVFRPMPHGRFQAIARILPGEWKHYIDTCSANGARCLKPG